MRGMRLSTLLGPGLRATLAQEPESLKSALGEVHPEDIAEVAAELELEDLLGVLRVLPHHLAAGVLERLPAERQAEVFTRLTVEESASLLSEMSPDDRADVLQELDESLASAFIAHLERHEPEVYEEVRELSLYPEDAAGGLMTPEYAAMSPETKVWQAIEEVRRLSRLDEVETISYVYVTYGERLVGVASLRDLILADPGQTLADIMTEHLVTVRDTDDQELVAQTIAKYDFSAVPVVDEQGAMVGLVTVDDVVDVVIEEATEDAHLMGAVSPMEGGFFDSDLLHVFRSRISWLVLLFVGGLATASVMERYEVELHTVIALAVFIPLIISSGGNAGSQSASLVIRALAVGEVQAGDWWRVFGRELVISMALGLVLGLLGFGRVVLMGEGPSPIPMAITVSTSIVAVVVVGSLVGSLLPIGIQRVGFDPAVSSTPFIASMVDVVGLLIYLSIAKMVFHLG